MGRGGGSSGGSSGGHGRSHYGGSSGGSRGGGGSSRSSSSRSYPSSRRYSSYRSTRVYTSGRIPGGSYQSGPVDPLQKYKSALVIWNVFIVTALFIFGGILFNGNITSSTITRTPLQANQCIESADWFEDHDGTWIYNPGKLISGMKEFYKITGIQPYLVIDTGDINGNDRPSAQEYESYLLDIYSKKFSDGGHLVLGFNEPEPSSYGMYYVIGDEAKAMFDDEAGEILFDYIDHYYTTDLSDEEMFATAFSKAANRIMKKSFTVTQALTIVIAIVLLGNIVILTLFGMAVYKNKKAESDREVAKVLSAKIEDVTDTSLKDKYLQ